MIERLLIASLEGESDSVALTLEQCELGLDLYRASLQVLAQGLIQASSYREKPPVGDPHLQLELVALNQVVCVLIGVGHLRHAPMVGAAIF